MSRPSDQPPSGQPPANSGDVTAWAGPTEAPRDEIEQAAEDATADATPTPAP